MKAMLKKIDFKGLLMETGAEMATLAVLGEVQKMPLVQKIKPLYKAIGFKVIAALMKSKKANPLMEGAHSVISVAGSSQGISLLTKGRYPAIGGYESNPIAGYEFEEGVGDAYEDEGNVGAVVIEE